jgi:hypothetical protein
LKNLEQKYESYKQRFNELKSKRIEMERFKKRGELLPPSTSEKQSLLSGEYQYYEESQRLESSEYNIDSSIEIGMSALGNLRSQGKVMKVLNFFDYFRDYIKR